MAPPRRLALQGRVFAFHGVARQPREQWTRVLEARGATVLRDWRDPANARVVVLTDWWVDVVPRTTSAVYVTEYWLRESLRLGEWLAPDAHPFFTPPAVASSSSSLQLSYPMDYDDGALTPVTTTTLARLPCSPLNLYEDVVPLWPYIVAYLREPTGTTAELAAVLQRITGEVRHPLNCLCVAIDDLLNPTDHQLFFDSVLPVMKQLVLDLPFSFRKSLQLLPPIDTKSATTYTATRLREESVHLTRAQLLPLLSAMFLSVFPAQAHVSRVEFPWFSMESMFSAPRSMPDFVLLKAHKIRTILEYFLRIVPRFTQAPDELQEEIVTFTRVALEAPFDAASASNTPANPSTILQSLAVVSTTSGDMSDVRIETSSLIEDLASHLQIDFANKFAGGGVMNGGAVQEEIRFILSPELMVACLVFARLEPNESFVIHGTERFSNYTGYGGTFRFAGSVQDSTPFETANTIDRLLQKPQRRRQSVVVGIDAISYSGTNVNRQYSQRSVLRELRKALVGFAYPDAHTTTWPIATGNWGCGVFRGDPELKFLIQWLAASLTGRPMVYVIFEQTSDLQDKITAVLRECEHVPERMSRVLPQWILEFLLQLDAELEDRSGRAGPLRGSIRNQGWRGRDARGGGAPARRRANETILERAAAFVRVKASAERPSASVGDDSIGDGYGGRVPVAPEVVPASDTTSVSLTPSFSTTPTTKPTRTAATTPRHRTSENANGVSGGPQLKQPKLTAFWK